MKKFSIIVASIVSGLSLPNVSAQAPTPPAPQERQVAAKLNLTMEQRYTIKEIIKDQKIQSDNKNVKISVGDVVPTSVVLRAMPSEIGNKVSQVKSHKFFLNDNRVVIVDPKDNKVVEVIE